MGKVCEHCKKLKDIMEVAETKPHEYLRIVYDQMYEMYKNKNLKLYFSDCSFEHFFKELCEEKHYTYDIYMQCCECERIFELGVCIRGCPVYKVLDEKPDINKLAGMARMDKKQCYYDED
ncbi:MAG: hypothetical protein IJY83_09260 [Oscillospiraceae bacterium]|nr:hypothetical protein [Oscillospiraceae bacterium]